jgi:hypothetical protein
VSETSSGLVIRLARRLNRGSMSQLSLVGTAICCLCLRAAVARRRLTLPELKLQAVKDAACNCLPLGLSSSWCSLSSVLETQLFQA